MAHGPGRRIQAVKHVDGDRGLHNGRATLFFLRCFWWKTIDHAVKTLAAMDQDTRTLPRLPMESLRGRLNNNLSRQSVKPFIRLSLCRLGLPNWDSSNRLFCGCDSRFSLRRIFSFEKSVIHQMLSNVSSSLTIVYNTFLIVVPTWNHLLPRIYCLNSPLHHRNSIWNKKKGLWFTVFF